VSLTISLSKTLVKPGEEITCYFDYTNYTMSRYGYKVSIAAKLDGKLVYSDSMDFPGTGGEWTGNFTFRAPSTPGAHILVVEASTNESGYWKTDATSSATFTVQGSLNPIKSWSVSLDKTTVSPGDTVQITATVDWEAPGGIGLKLDISAFGRSWEASYPNVSTSPAVLKTQITVPSDASSGTHDVDVTLKAYY